MSGVIRSRVGLPPVRAVALASEGGTYDDDAFMAGWIAAAVDSAIEWHWHNVPGCWIVGAIIPSPLIPQMELLAARADAVMSFPADDDDDALTAPEGTQHVVFTHHDEEIEPLLGDDGEPIIF